MEKDKPQPNNFCFRPSTGKRLVLSKSLRSSHDLDDSSSNNYINSLKSDIHIKANTSREKDISTSALSPSDVTRMWPKSSDNVKEKVSIAESNPVGDVFQEGTKSKPESSADADANLSPIQKVIESVMLNKDNSLSDDETTPLSTQAAEEENLPCGIKLKRAEYYTLPPLDDLQKHMNSKGECFIKGFTVGRVGYGNVHFPDRINVTNLNLDEIVHIRNQEIVVYPENVEKPPVGTELNRPAQCTLDNVFPKDPTTKELITDPQQILKVDFTQRLTIVAQRQGSKFIEYRPETGSYVFAVEHFSKYYYDDEADEEARQIQQKMEAEKNKKAKDVQVSRTQNVY